MSQTRPLTTYLTRLLDLSGPSTDPRDEGLARFRAGDHEGALLLLLAVEEEGRGDRQVYAALGAILLRRCRYSEALERLEIASELARDDAQVFYQLGEAYRGLCDFEAAECAYRRAILMRPAFTDAHIQRGVTLSALGRDDEAINAFEQAIFLDRQALVARYHLARLCVARQQYARATAQLHVIKAMRPDYAPVYVLAAEVAERQGHHRQVLDELGHLVKRKLADAHTFHRIGLAHHRLKEPTEALAAFTRAIALGQAPIEASCYAARLHETLGQHAPAVALYARLATTSGYEIFGQRGLDRVKAALTAQAAPLAA